MLTITGGKYRGQKIKHSQLLKQVKATSSKVREALFNILQDTIINASFCDLFAGTGAVGLEAVSRGARSVTLVEKHFKTVLQLKQNIDKLNASSLCVVQVKNVYECNKENINSFDIVFADPPFTDSFDTVFDLVKSLVCVNGVGIIQFPTRLIPNWLSCATTIKEYGESKLAFFYFS